MSRQIQIRRGTTAQHENFTGRIGEITMDTDAKTLRVHDGETVGGIPLARKDGLLKSFAMRENSDSVIESGRSGDNWYRKYSSGWVEQGGEKVINVKEHTLPVEMADTNYDVLVSPRNGFGITVQYQISSGTQIILTSLNTAGAEYNAWAGSWRVSGMAKATVV